MIVWVTWSAVEIICAFAWKLRCAVIMLTSSAVRSTFDSSSAPACRLPRLPEPGSPTIGVPDANSGEAVKLFVVRRDPSLTEADLRKHCEENLTGYKRPKRIEFRADLPKSNVGKVLRKELKAEEKAKL